MHREFLSISWRSQVWHCPERPCSPSQAVFDIITTNRRILMRLNVWKSMRLAFVSAICLTLSVGMTFAAATDSGQIASGQKAKIKGVIVSRSGDLVKIQDKKSDAVEVVKLEESTRIEREKGLRAF